MIIDTPRVYAMLAEQFCAHFSETLSGIRRVGREAEFPVCTQSGFAADVSRLLPLLQEGGNLAPKYEGRGETALLVALEGEDFSYSLEVGRSTIELVTRPCGDLSELERVWRRGMARLLKVTESADLRLLGYGIQPRSRAKPSLMTPKSRYHALSRRMGPDWLWYTVSASDQLHVEIRRNEMIPILNVALGLTGAIISLCAHSPLAGGRLTGFASTREGRFLEGSYAPRHGLPERPFISYADFAHSIAQLPHLLVRRGDTLVEAQESFHEYLLQVGPDLDAFLLHDHYVWQSARLRAAHGTIEMRAACQQPPDEAMAAAALYLGIVEGAEQLALRLDLFSPERWKRLIRYRCDGARSGLSAPQPDDDFLSALLSTVHASLESRGRGEERYLQPVLERFKKAEEPAQRVRRLFYENDWERLLDTLTYSSDSLVG